MKATLAVWLVASLGGLVACADMSTAPLPRGPHMSAIAQAGDPPPPPADGAWEPIILQTCASSQTPPGTIVPCILQIALPLQTRILINPGGNAGFVEFSSNDPQVIVSSDARVKGTPGKTMASGTIVFPYQGRNVVADLSTATISFGSAPFPPDFVVDDYLAVYAPIAYDNGDPVLVPGPNGVTFWYVSIELAYR